MESDDEEESDSLSSSDNENNDGDDHVDPHKRSGEILTRVLMRYKETPAGGTPPVCRWFGLQQRS